MTEWVANATLRFKGKVKKKGKKYRIPVPKDRVWKLEFARNITKGKTITDIFTSNPPPEHLTLRTTVKLDGRPSLEILEEDAWKLRGQEDTSAKVFVSVPDLTNEQRMERIREVLRLVDAGWGIEAVGFALDITGQYAGILCRKYKRIRDIDSKSPELFLRPPAAKALKKTLGVTDLIYAEVKERLETDITWGRGISLQGGGLTRIFEIREYCAEHGIQLINWRDL